MKEIKIIKESCGGCPMIWDVILPDGSAGYIRYRWGIISLKKITERPGIFQDAIIEQKLGNDFDGTITLKRAIRWLKNKGYIINLELYETTSSPNI